jgi:DNA-binding CsgD family transcriptional regulator/PAS domain-containing protein
MHAVDLGGIVSCRYSTTLSSERMGKDSMRSREDLLTKTIDKIYDCAIDPSGWTRTLELLSDVIGGRGAAIFPVPDPRVFQPVWTDSIEGLAQLAFRSEHAVYNVRAPRALQLRNRIVTEHDVCSDWELVYQPFNAEMRKIGWLHDAGCVFTEVQGVPLIFTTHRRVHEEPFSERETAVIRALLPHLRRATQMSSRLGEARLDGHMEALEAVTVPTVVIGRHGRVWRLNAAAESLIGSVLAIEHGKLVTRHSAARQEFEAMIAAVVDPFGGTPGTRRAVAIPRDVGPPYIAIAARLGPASQTATFSMPRALVMIIDSLSERDHTGSVMRQAFGLTAAEARLAQALVLGKDLALIAEETRVSIATLRTQLKAVLAKTSTHRQAELVALLARLV